MILEYIFCAHSQALSTLFLWMTYIRMVKPSLIHLVLIYQFSFLAGESHVSFFHFFSKASNLFLNCVLSFIACQYYCLRFCISLTVVMNFTRGPGIAGSCFTNDMSCPSGILQQFGIIARKHLNVFYSFAQNPNLSISLSSQRFTTSVWYYFNWDQRIIGEFGFCLDRVWNPEHNWFKSNSRVKYF